jgi:hypothetical protein
MGKAILAAATIVILGALILAGIAACGTWTTDTNTPGGYYPAYHPYPAATGNHTYTPPRTTTRKSVVPPRRQSGGFGGRRR